MSRKISRSIGDIGGFDQVLIFLRPKWDWGQGVKGADSQSMACECLESCLRYDGSFGSILCDDSSNWFSSRTKRANENVDWDKQCRVHRMDTGMKELRY